MDQPRNSGAPNAQSSLLCPHEDLDVAERILGVAAGRRILQESSESRQHEFEVQLPMDSSKVPKAGGGDSSDVGARMTSELQAGVFYPRGVVFMQGESDKRLAYCLRRSGSKDKFGVLAGGR
jgi:hypothetical protein